MVVACFKKKTNTKETAAEHLLFDVKQSLSALSNTEMPQTLNQYFISVAESVTILCYLETVTVSVIPYDFYRINLGSFWRRNQICYQLSCKYTFVCSKIKQNRKLCNCMKITVFIHHAVWYIGTNVSEELTACIYPEDEGTRYLKKFGA